MYVENFVDVDVDIPQEFVHRARVHEMLKCLKSEHAKLQVSIN
jgi:hypothetical protein